MAETFDPRRYINSAINKTYPTRLTLEPSERETGQDEENARRKVGGFYRINRADKGPMPSRYDIGGVLTVRDENGEFKPVNEDQIASGENFYLFGEGEDGPYIVSSGRKETDGSLLLTGVEQKGGQDMRALEMGAATLFDAFAGVSGALGGDDAAKSARETAEDIRAYSAPKLPKNIAYEYNKGQKPFDILNPRDIQDIVLQSVPFQGAYAAPLAIARTVGSALKAKGSLHAILAGGATNATINYGIVREEVMQILTEQGIPQKDAATLADRAGFLPAVVSAITGGAGGLGNVGKGATMAQRASPFGMPMGGIPIESGGEIVEEVSQAMSKEYYTGDEPPHGYENLALAAGVGGAGGQLVVGGTLSSLGDMANAKAAAHILPRSVAAREFVASRPVRALTKRAARLANVDNAVNEDGGDSQSNNPGKLLVKSIQDIQKWRGRRDEVMAMSHHDLKVMFGKYFDSSEYTPEQVRSMVIELLDASDKYGDAATPAEVSPEMAKIMKAAKDGDETARQFLDMARKKTGAASDTEAAEMMNYMLGDNARLAFSDMAVGKFWQGVLPSANIGDGSSAAEAIQKIREMPVGDIVRAAPKIAKAFEESAKNDKTGFVNADGARETAEALKTTPMRALAELGLVDISELIDTAFKDAKLFGQLASDLGDKDLQSAENNLDTAAAFDAGAELSGLRAMAKRTAPAPDKKPGEKGATEPPPPAHAGVMPEVLKRLADALDNYDIGVRSINRFLARNHMEEMPAGWETQTLYAARTLGITGIDGILDMAASLVDGGHLPFEKVPASLRTMVLQKMGEVEGDTETETETDGEPPTDNEKDATKTPMSDAARAARKKRFVADSAFRDFEKKQKQKIAADAALENATKELNGMPDKQKFGRGGKLSYKYRKLQERIVRLRERAKATKEAVAKANDEMLMANNEATKAEQAAEQARTKATEKHPGAADTAKTNTSLRRFYQLQQQREAEEKEKAKKAKEDARSEKAANAARREQQKLEEEFDKELNKASNEARKVIEARRKRFMADAKAQQKEEDKRTADARKGGKSKTITEKSAADISASLRAKDKSEEGAQPESHAALFGDARPYEKNEEQIKKEREEEERAKAEAAAKTKATPSGIPLIAPPSPTEPAHLQPPTKPMNGPLAEERKLAKEAGEKEKVDGIVPLYERGLPWIFRTLANDPHFSDLKLKPRMFQHRVGADEKTGKDMHSRGKLHGKNNEDDERNLYEKGLAGTMTLFRGGTDDNGDPTPNQLWVVNGHQRYNMMARRVKLKGPEGVEAPSPQIFDEEDGWTELGAFFWGGFANVQNDDHTNNGIPRPANVLDAANLYMKAADATPEEVAVFQAALDKFREKEDGSHPSSFYLGEQIAKLQPDAWLFLLSRRKAFENLSGAKDKKTGDPIPDYTGMLQVAIIAEQTNNLLTATGNRRAITPEQAAQLQIAVMNVALERARDKKPMDVKRLKSTIGAMITVVIDKLGLSGQSTLEFKGENFEQLLQDLTVYAKNLDAVNDRVKSVLAGNVTELTTTMRSGKTLKKYGGTEGDKAKMAADKADAEKRVKAFNYYLELDREPAPGFFDERDKVMSEVSKAGEVKKRRDAAIKSGAQRLADIVSGAKPEQLSEGAKLAVETPAEAEAKRLAKIRGAPVVVAAPEAVNKMVQLFAEKYGLPGVTARGLSGGDADMLGAADIRNKVIFVAENVDNKTLAPIVAHEMGHLLWEYGSAEVRAEVERMSDTWRKRNMFNGSPYMARVDASLRKAGVYEKADKMPEPMREQYKRDAENNELFALAIEDHIRGRYAGDFISKVRAFFRNAWRMLTDGGKTLRLMDMVENGEFMNPRRKLGAGRLSYANATNFAMFGMSPARAKTNRNAMRALDEYKKAGGKRAKAADIERIWRDTGFILGVDGKLRFEVADPKLRDDWRETLASYEASLRSFHRSKSTRYDDYPTIPLNKLVDAPEIFKQLPQLANARVVMRIHGTDANDGVSERWVDEVERAFYYPDNNEISLVITTTRRGDTFGGVKNMPDSLGESIASVIAHEVQLGVQNFTGTLKSMDKHTQQDYARDDVYNMILAWAKKQKGLANKRGREKAIAYAEALLNASEPTEELAARTRARLRKRLDEMKKDKSVASYPLDKTYGTDGWLDFANEVQHHADYIRQPIEAEAREVQNRRDKSAAWRAKNPPKWDGVPFSEMTRGFLFAMMNAFHGTDTDIKDPQAFWDYVGSGEGFAAFGFGHYLTDIKPVAKHYAKARSGDTGRDTRKYLGDVVGGDKYDMQITVTETIYAGVKVVTMVDIEAAKHRLAVNISRKASVEEIAADIRKVASEWDDGTAEGKKGTAKISKNADEFARLIHARQKEIGSVKPKPKVYNYTLDSTLAGHDEFKMLNWEKPVDEETRSLIADFLVNEDGDTDEMGEGTDEWEEYEYGEEPFRALYNSVANKLEFSKYLASHGIDGWSYEPGTIARRGKKNKDPNKRNYVIVNPKIIASAVEEKGLRFAIEPSLSTPKWWEGEGKWQDDPRLAGTKATQLVYHGTEASFTDFADAPFGTFFSTSKEGALFQGRRNSDKNIHVRVIPARLSLKNPVHIDLNEKDPAKRGTDLMTAKERGHDGAIIKPYKSRHDGEMFYVVFNTSQIISAVNGYTMADSEPLPDGLNFAVEAPKKALGKGGKYNAEKDPLFKNASHWVMDSYYSRKPKTIYVGSPDGKSVAVEGFDKDKLGSHTNADSARAGFFASDNREVAKTYASRFLKMAFNGESGRVFDNLERAQYLLDWFEQSDGNADVRADEGDKGEWWGKWDESEKEGVVYDATTLRSYPSEEEAIAAAQEEIKATIRKTEDKVSRLSAEWKRLTAGMDNNAAVLDIHMAMDNPLVVSAKDKWDGDLEDKINEAKDGGYDGLIVEDIFDPYITGITMQEAKDTGVYDRYLGTHFVVFDAGKIVDAKTGRRLKK